MYGVGTPVLPAFESCEVGKYLLLDCTSGIATHRQAVDLQRACSSALTLCGVLRERVLLSFEGGAWHRLSYSSVVSVTETRRVIPLCCQLLWCKYTHAQCIYTWIYK